MPNAFWLRIGAIWGFLAVAMGAFGAHGLQDRFRTLGDLPGGLGTERLEANFHTAAQYHMYCALALLVVGLLAVTGRQSPTLQVAGWSLLLGSLIFSGSLYILCVTGLRWLGAITPIGGVAILAGWLALALAAGSMAIEPPGQLPG
ncbi:MAG: DUF423 domain-containing protein [Isosphaeraceae bacterium]